MSPRLYDRHARKEVLVSVGHPTTEVRLTVPIGKEVLCVGEWVRVSTIHSTTALTWRSTWETTREVCHLLDVLA